MSRHKLTEAAIEQTARRVYARSLVNAILLLAGAMILIWRVRGSWYSLLLIGPVVLIGMWRAMNRSEKRMRGYELDLGADSVTLLRNGRREQRILYEEIAFAAEVPGKGLMIRTSDRKRQIGIAADLEGYGTVRDRIASYSPIQPAQVKP